METINLGHSNLRVSRIAFGAMSVGSSSWRPWVCDEAASEALIARALELGVSFFDTSDYYSNGESERVLGKALARAAGREEVVIATKVGNPMGPGPGGSGYSRKHIMSAVEDSLRRLGTDYIDLYQTHIWHEPTRIEEVLETFHDLIVSGKVRYVGVTDMPVWRVAELVYKARAMGLRELTSVQHHYNLVWRGAEQELMPFCEHEGLGTIPYSPLARGFLAAGERGHDRDTQRGRSDDFAREWYGRPDDEAVAAAVARVASARGTSAAAVALAWVMQRSPRGVPLIGATRVEQLDVITEAGQCRLDPAELDELEAGYRPRLRYGH